MGKENLFVYGTLMEPDVLKKVIGRTAKGFPDILQGYKKSVVRIGNGAYPVIFHGSGSHVKGLIISVTPQELELIDEYETGVYKRKKVNCLESGKNAWVYIRN